MNRLFPPIALAMLLALHQPAFSQVLYGSIVGTVEDPSGAVVPNAALSLKYLLKSNVHPTVPVIASASLFQSISGIAAKVPSPKRSRKSALPPPWLAIESWNLFPPLRLPMRRLATPAGVECACVPILAVN